MDVKIGLQLYSIRSAMESDFFGSLEKVKAAGYSCVEFAGYGSHTAAAIRKEMDRIGLEAFSTHLGADQLVNHLDEVASFSKELGLSWVVCPGYQLKTAADCQAISDILVNAAKKLNPLGIRVAYHNHHRELAVLDGEIIFNRILKNTSGAKIHAEVDTCWVQYADVDPVAFIDGLGDLAGPLHFKDINENYKQLKGEEINVEVGNGIIDFPAIIKVARKNKILGNGLIVEQEAFTRDMFESIKISCDNIRSMLA